MGLKEAVPFLIGVLEDDQQNEITRHECGEALGNLIVTLSEPEEKRKVIKVLFKQLDDDSIIVSQTCQLSLDKIYWIESVDERELKSVQCDRFSTHDPAPQFAEMH